MAPMAKANVITTVRVKPGRLRSSRTLYRRSCQKVSISYGGSRTPQSEVAPALTVFSLRDFSKLGMMRKTGPRQNEGVGDSSHLECGAYTIASSQ